MSTTTHVTMPEKFLYPPEGANKLSQTTMDLADVYGCHLSGVEINGVRSQGPFEFFVTAGRLVIDNETRESMWLADTQVDRDAVRIGSHMGGATESVDVALAAKALISRGLAIHMRDGRVVRTAEPGANTHVLTIPFVRSILVVPDNQVSDKVAQDPINVYPLT